MRQETASFPSENLNPNPHIILHCVSGCKTIDPKFEQAGEDANGAN
jgi:hypothetical protein